MELRDAGASFFRGFAVFKTYFLLGWMYPSTVSGILVYVLTLKSYYETIAAFGVPMWLLYVITPVAVLTVSLIMGYITYHYISKHEQELAYRNTKLAYEASQKQMKMYDMVQEMYSAGKPRRRTKWSRKYVSKQRGRE